MLHTSLSKKAKEECISIAVHWQDADSSPSNAMIEYFTDAEIMICGGHAGKAHKKQLEKLAKMKSFTDKYKKKHREQFQFSSGPTLRSLLTKVKDPLPVEKQLNVVYEVPCTCGKVYIGETKRRLGTQLKEHRDACAKCLTDKSAIAKHAWTSNHPINWARTRVLQ